MTLLMRDNEMVKKGREEGWIESIRNMIKYGVPKETILRDYTEDEYASAMKGDPSDEN